MVSSAVVHSCYDASMLRCPVLCCAVLCCDICNAAWQGLVQLQGELVSGLLPPPHPLRAQRSIPFCPKQIPPVSRLQSMACASNKAHLPAVQDSRAIRYTASIFYSTARQLFNVAPYCSMGRTAQSSSGIAAGIVFLCVMHLRMDV